MKTVYDSHMKKYMLRSDPVKRYYYHITDNSWPITITLEPRDKGDARDIEEPLIPRICVCPSVALCLCSIEICSSMTVYCTRKKVRSYYPVNVLDSEITDERWLLEPTEFIAITDLPKRVTDEVRSIFKKDFFIFGSDDLEDVRKQKAFKAKVVDLIRKHKLEYP